MNSNFRHVQLLPRNKANHRFKLGAVSLWHGNPSDGKAKSYQNKHHFHSKSLHISLGFGGCWFQAVLSAFDVPIHPAFFGSLSPFGQDVSICYIVGCGRSGSTIFAEILSHYRRGTFRPVAAIWAGCLDAVNQRFKRKSP